MYYLVHEDHVIGLAQILQLMRHQNYGFVFQEGFDGAVANINIEP